MHCKPSQSMHGRLHAAVHLEGCQRARAVFDDVEQHRLLIGVDQIGQTLTQQVTLGYPSDVQAS